MTYDDGKGDIMPENAGFDCEHCGAKGLTESELEIGHRSCRLKAAFPGAYSQDGALVAFDMAKVADALGIKQDRSFQPGSDRGLRFTRSSPDNGLWITASVAVGNTLSEWSWWLSNAEWDATVAAMAAAREQAAP